ncbi:hypothetical protein Tco_0697851, partial [Tanacetum coccineum]
FSEKLSSWKAKNVSYGGRLTLVKSVLGSLPLYCFSLFRAPLKVINVLEGIRRQFFWGGAHGDSRKISWIAWDKVLSSSEFGGLNIGSLKALNWSLLAKWWWRFKTEKNSLWKKVVCSFHGSDGNLGVACDVDSPSTWGKIVSIGNELEKIDISFSLSFHKKIGSGHDTRFWIEIWSGNTSFSEKYPRHFALETNQRCLVNQKLVSLDSCHSRFFGHGVGPSGRDESELNDLQHEISSIILSSNPNSWRWSLHPSGQFSVSAFRAIIDSKLLGHLGFKLRWNNLVPSKINILAWRIRNYRLPTRANIDKRGIDIHSILYTALNVLEMADDGDLNFGEKISSLFDVVVLCAIWWIWRARNLLVFQAVKVNMINIIDDIIATSYLWIKNRAKFRFACCKSRMSNTSDKVLRNGDWY